MNSQLHITSHKPQSINQPISSIESHQPISPLTTAASGSLDAEMFADLRALRSDKYPNVLARLIDTFYTEALLQIATMRSALEHTDVAGIRQAAHRLRGASASLGASALATRCSELEACAQANTIVDAFEYIQAIEAEFVQVQQEVKCQLV